MKLITILKRSLFPFKSSIKGGGIFLVAAWSFFNYTVFSGALRKWVFGPGEISNIIFFIQLNLYFIFFLVTCFAKFPPRFRMPVIFGPFVLYLIAAAFNPKNLTVYHGLFGLIIHLGFWVGLIAYYRYRDLFELEKLVGLFLIILIVQVVLGSIQYSLPEEHMLNIKSDGNAANALVSSGVRVSGTFSYLGGYQVLITFYGFMIWALLVLEFPVALTAFVFCLSVYGALISGSRGSMFILLLLSGFSFMYTGVLFRRLLNVIGTLAIFGSLLFYFGEGLLANFDMAYENFNERLEWGQESGEAEARIIDYYTQVVDFPGKYPIYGIGLGSTYQGAKALFGESFFARDFGYYESELTRIILEGGFILLFCRMLILFVFLRNSYIPAVGQVIVIGSFLLSMITFNVFQGVFFLFGLMLLDRAYYLKSKRTLCLRALSPC